jgi:SAM-dependent methyltransferase
MRSAGVGRSQSAVVLFHDRALARCEACDLVFLASQPTESDLAKLNSHYWEVAQEYTAFAQRVHEAQMISRAEYLKQHLGALEGKKVVDVGAGYGILNKVLRDQGQLVHFHPIEVDERCYSRLRRYGAESISRDLAACGIEEFNVAVLSHVLEHVRDPRDLLEAVRTKLADGGYLFIEVPNQDHLHKPNIGTHLLFFSPDSLGSLLRAAGFAVHHLDTVGAPLVDLVTASAGNAGWAASPNRGLWRAKLRRTRAYRIGSRLADVWRAATVSLDTIRAELQLATYGPGRQWIRCLAALPDTRAESK